VKISIRRAGPFGPAIRLAAAAAAMLIAWRLKRHYSDARPDDLWWILAPTTHLVGGVTGANFTLQPGEGYFARDRLFLIEKSCAGINFMVAAFGMLVFALLHRVSSPTRAVHILGVTLIASYFAAVVVNALRIVLAMWLAAHPPALPAFNAAHVHRLEGIIVYFGSLVLLYELVQRLDRQVAGRVLPLSPEASVDRRPWRRRFRPVRFKSWCEEKS
jgi:exosortase K